MATTVDERRSHNYIPRFVLHPEGGTWTLSDRRQHHHVEGLSVERVVDALFKWKVAVVEVVVTGSGLTLAQELEDWGAVTVVRVRS